MTFECHHRCCYHLVNGYQEAARSRTPLLAGLLPYLSSFSVNDLSSNHNSRLTHILIGLPGSSVYMRTIIGCSRCHRYQQRKSVYLKSAGRDVQSFVHTCGRGDGWGRMSGGGAFEETACWGQRLLNSLNRKELCCFCSFLTH